MSEEQLGGPGEASPHPVVWLLEDSLFQAEATVLALSSRYQVTHFADSAGLLEALSTAQPDVLVLDWELPEISGLEVLRVLRATHDEAAVPVLMLTARRAQHELVEALGSGANDFASKPCDAHELNARIGTLARVSALHRRSQRAERHLQEALKGEAAARLREQTQRQELYDLFMQAPVAVALLRGPDQVCEYANAAAQAMIG